MVPVLSILERLVRREREARNRDRPRHVDENRRRRELPEVVPAGVKAGEWSRWDEAARYVFLERLGVGDELGVGEADATSRAVAEARMVQAGVPWPSWGVVGLALRVFEGSRIVAVKPRSEP